MISMKLFPSLPSDVSSGSGISPRRVGRPNQSSVVADYSAHFGGVHCPVVISTRSNSSPTRESLGICVKCERISGLDMNHLFPSKVASRNRVNDFYTFIGNYQSWPLNDTVKEYSNEGTHQGSPKEILSVASKNRLDYCSKQEKVSKHRSDNPRFRSEYFGIFQAGSPRRKVGQND